MYLKMKFKTRRIILCMCVVCVLVCIVGILLDRHVGEYEIADYILFLLNQRKEFGFDLCVCVSDKVLLYSYTNMFNIPEPCDVNDEVLTYVAKRLHALEKGG